MAELIPAPTRIPVPGGKVIDEYVGRVNNGEQRLSVAHMRAPGGWSEPAQVPAFDEYTVVLAGTLLVRHEDGTTEVRGGEAVLTPAGELVQYSVGPEGAEYVAVCLPAFAPELANREAEA